MLSLYPEVKALLVHQYLITEILKKDIGEH